MSPRKDAFSRTELAPKRTVLIWNFSRADYYWTNDSHSFNQSVFDETRSYWKGPIIDIKEAAAARIARVHTSQTTNPTYSMSDLGFDFSIGETAAYIVVIGDRVSGTVKKSFVEYLFGECSCTEIHPT